MFSKLRNSQPGSKPKQAATVLSGLGRRLFLLLLAISLVPLAGVSWLGYRNAHDSLQAGAIQSMATTIQRKKKYFQNFFAERLNDLRMQSALTPNVELLAELHQACKTSRLPAEEFVRSFAWARITTTSGVDLANFRQVQGYKDILLIDLDGNILYSARAGTELGTNILTGPAAATEFGKTCQRALALDKPQCSDIAFYAPADNKPALFLVQAVSNDYDDKIGLMAFQMGIEPINEIMQEHTGLGVSGETYLVGGDLVMRSDSRFETRPTVLSKQAHMDGGRRQVVTPENPAPMPGVPAETPPAADEAGIYTNFRGVEVLGVHSPLEVLAALGVNWVMVAAISAAEAHAPARILQYSVVVLVGVTGLLVFLLASAATRRLVTPVLALSRWAKQVAAGGLDKPEIPQAKYELAELCANFGRVVDSFRSVALVCESIAVGDFDRSVPIRSDHDQLGRAVNQMAENLRAVVRQADAVAQGDYTTEIIPRSPKDRLGHALFNMTQTLSDMAAEQKKRLWLQTGQTDLHDRLQGEHTVTTLAHNVVSCLAHILKVQIGAMFLLQGDNRLRMFGTYAYEESLNVSREFRLGEGLVGQAAQEGRSIVINGLPEDYIKVGSGLGEASPNNIAVVPFFFENKVKGILEFGSFREFSDRQIEFLELVAENIGVAVNTTESRLQTATLLDQSKSLAEELQVQQEELRQTNEELEEQTRALKISEERLQNQQEELRVANEELAERTKILEERGNAIQQKNDELENARLEIEKKAKALEIASRYKSEFLANMSHELRTPLNSILILSQLLSQNRNGNLTEKQQDYARTINTSGADLLNLINEVLDLAKIEAGKMEIHLAAVDLAELTESVTRPFKEIAAGKGLELTVDLAPDLPAAIRTDLHRVQQIIRNLLANACKFTETGTVGFNVFRVGRDLVPPACCQHAENIIAFRIADTGIGIPSDKQALIFEAFQQADGTTSRKFGGTGLGLSISREIAQALGGEIMLESEVGRGSTFTLFLPEKLDDVLAVPAKAARPAARVDAAASPAAVSAAPVNPAHLPAAAIQDDRRDAAKGDKILLVIEDDALFCQALYDLAHARDFKCLIASDGETGLHFADYYRPSAIILDIGLPGIDGHEVMARLKANPATCHIPVHFISAADDTLEAMRMGAIGYLTKPVSSQGLDQVFGKIEELLAKPVKKLLIVEDDAPLRKSIIELIGNSDVAATDVESGSDALTLLEKETFDCMILDLGLKDMSGFDLLAKIRNDQRISKLPVVIYTARELSRQEDAELQKYAESIIIKGARSPERLLAETTLFLHRVEADLPEEKRRMLRMVHDKTTLLQGRKILVVDDDMRNVFALSSVLEEKGLDIIGARNGREALEQLDKQPDIDLVLMDIMMPEMDGYQAMAAIRRQARFRTLPIIALTAKAMKGDRSKCIEAGANDYLAKPFDTDKLLSLLRVWLHK